MATKPNPAGFSTKHVLGIPEIDEQHETIFSLLDRIGNISAHGYRPLDDDEVDRLLDVLTELRESALTHFGTEEAFMQELDYPVLEAHATAHEHFLDDLTRLEGELMNGSAIPPVTMRGFLAEWYGEHILDMDKPLGDFYKKNSK